MDPSVSSVRRVRTGLFEIDLGAGEIHKEGRRVPLQEQPFRVLALLVERAGEVVTREELQSRLWPADTYVGFDEGLNTAIRKLRIALGDSSENPRFIETIPRRGYRFVAPVQEAVVGSSRDLGTAEAAGPAVELQTDGRGRRTRRVGWAFFAAGVFVVAAGATYLMRSRPPSNPSSHTRVMLAILPFVNLSNDPGQEYFSDGLTEETITDLGQLSPQRLGVIARTSAMTYKHTTKSIRQIGSELGVDYILEGSVRREGDQARVSAQLIRVSDQTHLWAENYERKLQDLLEVQNEIGKAIAGQVQLSLTAQEQLALSQSRAVNREAYDLYLKGRFYWNQRTSRAVKESIPFFQQAVAKDPNFALAYVGLADAYNISNIMGTYSPQESFPEAKAAADKALALDPSIAEAHAALGMEKSHYEFDFPGAEKEFLKAIELNPNSPYAHLFYSNCFLAPMGRIPEAIVENQKALALDPLSLPISNFMGVTYSLAGDYEKSYQQFQRTIAMDPTFPLAHAYFADLLIVMGKYEEAVKEREQAALLYGAAPELAAARANALLKVLKTRGLKGFGQENLKQDLKALKASGGAYFPASTIATDYALADEKDQAFEWLEKALQQREGQSITLLKCDPFFANLRGDPRLSDLLRRMGLPD
jgi:TolB-like protein/DNA-binding winged helix-turn-helix (wHTH) protein/Flp pilus assembly protein TadD